MKYPIFSCRDMIFVFIYLKYERIRVHLYPFERLYNCGKYTLSQTFEYRALLNVMWNLS